MRVLHLTSSNINAAAYDATTEHLFIQFKRKMGEPDNWYVYTYVPMRLVVEFLFAESHGEFFAKHIRNWYIAEKLNADKIAKFGLEP